MQGILGKVCAIPMDGPKEMKAKIRSWRQANTPRHLGTHDRSNTTSLVEDCQGVFFFKF